MIVENNSGPTSFDSLSTDKIQWQGRPVKTVKREDFITKIITDLLDLFHHLFGDDPVHSQFSSEYTNEYL